MTIYTTLVTLSELASHLNDENWVIFDCRFDLGNVEAGRQAYKSDHIPGACYVHLDEDLSSPITEKTGRHPLPDPYILAEKLGKWGVDHSKQVVVYDGGMGAMASRMWWLLRWMGHERIAVLEGGYNAWKAANLPLSSDDVNVTPAKFVLNIRDELLVNADFVDDIRTNNDYCVMDARAPERYRGDVEPLDKVAGHIPGAVNMPWENNLQAGGVFKPKNVLKELFLKQLGNVSPEHAVHSCGSGVTACHNVLAMEHAGLTGSKLYAGSWSEWITDPKRAVEKS